ncbi:MAG: dihydroorotase family protein [Armatimonadetes bacterium]|nr:dihydroorotase family protein [Anaerolineae bacterium]
MPNQLRINGVLDPHVHLRGMEWAHKGTFASETAAALAGGYWAVLDMPNTTPATLTPHALAHKLAEISANAVCDWGVYYGGAAAGNWDDYSAALYAQVCGLKLYNNETTGALTISDQATRAQHYAGWTSALPIAVHAEEATVDDILALVRQYRRFTHFCHVSSAYEIRALTAAKEAGLPISIGVCPHHLWLTRDDLPHLGGFGMMKPELETAADRDALWYALQAGIVDVVESDHAPHLISEKASESPPFGVPGLETTLPLLLTAVHEGRLTLEQVTALVADNPRRIFGIACPPETYTVLDLDADYTLDRADLHTLCGWSPFEGLRLRARVAQTWCRGVLVYDGERVLVQPGFGQRVQRA